MAKERVSMRKIKEVLRLKHGGNLTMRKIAQICGISRPAVSSYLLRFRASGLTWPLPDEITGDFLEKKLFPCNTIKSSLKAALDYEYMLQEIRRPNVTLEVLWSEYIAANPNGYQYSHFCELYRRYAKTLNYSMRQEHKAGEKNFVDFGSIDDINLTDRFTRETIKAVLFVSVWGASGYLFAKAVRGEDLKSWINVNIDSLEYSGCCPKAIVPDNLKSAVTKACRYEPEINPTYAEFARHYGVAIFPARPYQPKDKSRAENGVKLAKRWLLARLRNRIFHSLDELNAAIFELLEIFNSKKMKKFNKSRKELFEELDKPNALSLPLSRYEYAQWKQAKVQFNYHVSFEDHYYSVPYTLIHKVVDMRASGGIIEILHKGERVCSHQISYYKNRYTTVKEHMPANHQKYVEWTPERILELAEISGPHVKEIANRMMNKRKFPEQAYRACLGLLRLGNRYSKERLNAACGRAIEYRVDTYHGIAEILDKGLDKVPLESNCRSNSIGINHENIRGGQYWEHYTREEAIKQ
ncbi:MAG: IS21 family transposase [Candidatus Margulisiibacteriota bacterium]